MKKLCFVVMPFGQANEYSGKGEEADFVYNDVIKPAVQAAVTEFKTQYGDRLEHDIEVIREIDNTSPGDITASIIRHLADAHIAIIDLTLFRS